MKSVAVIHAARVNLINGEHNFDLRSRGRGDCGVVVETLDWRSTGLEVDPRRRKVRIVRSFPKVFWHMNFKNNTTRRAGAQNIYSGEKPQKV